MLLVQLEQGKVRSCIPAVPVQANVSFGWKADIALRSSPTDDAAVSELQVWLAIAAGLFLASGIVCFLLASRPEWIGLVAVPFVASVAATIYLFAFDPNPQAGVFLLIFYFVAGVAGAFGSLAGRALRNRSR